MKSENSFSLSGLANLANLAYYIPEEPETTCHGFTLDELEAEAGEDWQEVKDNPDVLDTFARSLAQRRDMAKGKVPDHYTKAAECAVCGPVWLWGGVPDKVQGCPWCFNRAKGLPVPCSGPVRCRECAHWIPDTINPVGGLGRCKKNVPGLAWPRRVLRCTEYLKKQHTSMLRI